MARQHPLAEVFGFPADNLSGTAEQFRHNRLCPFNNRVPSCTKDKATDPLGVCSIIHNHGPVITCPVRFTENWLITSDAATFFFSDNATWTALREVRLVDLEQNSAGNIDYVLVEYDTSGKILDFGAVEVQAVYISGNVRRPFEEYMRDRGANRPLVWEAPSAYYPTPDYLSSSRKRLIPQMLYKGGILKSWGKKQAIALQSTFFATLPELPQVDPQEADIAWLLYDLYYDKDLDRYRLTTTRTVYTRFSEAMVRISTPIPGNVDNFLGILQRKLDENLGASPDAPLLSDIPLQ